MTFLIIVIGLVLIFDFINGFHDSANSIATVVSTKVLSPVAAVALTLFGATHFGIPVSTTHTITGSIIGAGARKGTSAVKWGVTTRIFWAWILTIPVSALIGAAIYSLLHLII
jgi:inorganic phosphate transporter, PiT family